MARYQASLRSSQCASSRSRRLAFESLEARRLLANGSPFTPTSVTVFEDDFEDGQGGFVADNSGGTLTGLWHYSVGRRHDGLPQHSEDHSFYYGAFETATGGGHYVLGADHRGVLSSPPIDLPDCELIELTFDYLLDTRATLDRDYIDVSVDDGDTTTSILSRQEGTLPQTNHLWEEAYSDALSAYGGRTIRLHFTFDTGDPPRVDPEGWYVDDIRIVATCAPVPDIAGYKWEDWNRDGVWDEGEPSLSDWSVYLDQNDNGQLDAGEVSTLTDGDGHFEFYGVPSGVYTLRELMPNAQWEQTYPGLAGGGQQITIDPPNGSRVSGRRGVAESPNFGNTPPDIAGFKWDDLLGDQDGVWEDGEPGLNDRTIYLDLNANKQLDDGEPSFVTRFDGQHDGAFWFNDLAAGTYTLRQTEDSSQSYPGPPDFEHTVAIDAANGVRARGGFEATEPPNFGDGAPAEPVPDIAGYKWEDWDRDGLWDAGEPGLSGWTVYLDDNGNDQLDENEPSTLTDTMGYFEFFGLTAGNYSIREVIPNQQWEQTYPGAPADEHEVSIDPANGVRAIGALEETEAPNFGNSPPDIAGYKWDDLDGDGLWDEDEPGLNDRIVYLDLNQNGSLDAAEPEFVTRSDGLHDGAYWFIGLAPDDYHVRQLLDASQTYPGSPAFEHVVTIDPPAGLRVQGDYQMAEPPNFGDLVPDIAGYLWLDLNENGMWDSAEPVLSGWTVYLDRNNNDVLDAGESTSVTDGNGRFVFADLATGTYSVREQPPSDAWEQTYVGPSAFEHAVAVDPLNGIAVVGGFESTEPPNFGNRLVPEPDTLIGGLKFNDADRNGVFGGSDVLLGGWQISVYDDSDNNGLLSQAEFDAGPLLTNTTALDGSYRFNVAGGTFPRGLIVVELMQNGYQQTEFAGSLAYPASLVLTDGLNTGTVTLGARGYAIILEGGEDLQTLSFGNAEVCTSKRCYLASS